MNKINLGIIVTLFIQASAFIWFLSSQNSKIDTLYKFYEEESEKSVLEKQVKMQLDLEYVMKELKSIKKDIKQSKNKSKEIIQQHNEIFDLLKNNRNVPSGYEY